MASVVQTFPKMLKVLRENSNTKDKRDALTYIRSHVTKLESTGISKQQCKELCRLIMDACINGDHDMRQEAYDTLNSIIQNLNSQNLNLFESLLQANRKNRLKILKLLDVMEDNIISKVAKDPLTLNFFDDCMRTVQVTTMEWLSPHTCKDNIKKLIEVENKILTDDERIEEEMINYTVNLIIRLYKYATLTQDDKIHRFDGLLMDRVIVLAYMGHKRQRGPALKLLQQVIMTSFPTRVCIKFCKEWAEYKTALQSIYSKRMILLVTACEPDWATQWNVSIEFLGTDLHRGASLINNLLGVEERAFKSTDTIIRRQAFLSWKLLVDNFALDPLELATVRRIKLLCIPLSAKNSKTELIALTKLEVWWHLIVKLYKDIANFANPVITQFLNFCFGPLGDTPLLSSKIDIVASPGKRFFKTKVVAVDALCQLLVVKQETQTVISPMLEERLPHVITDEVFQECSRNIIHSVGETLLILSQLTDKEMKNKYQLGKILWSSLMNYIQETKLETKNPLYIDIILVTTELSCHAVDKPMIKNLFLEVILCELTNIIKNVVMDNNILLDLLLKLLSLEILREMTEKHWESLSCFILQCIQLKESSIYRRNTLKILENVIEKIKSFGVECENTSIIPNLWCIIVKALTKFMENSGNINEGDVKHNFKTVQSILVFPFVHNSFKDLQQIEKITELWKNLYNKFTYEADLILTVQPNEILLSIANIIETSLKKDKGFCCFAVHCLDALLKNINYNALLAPDNVSSVVQLIIELALITFDNPEYSECETVLKVLSTVLSTIYNHSSVKTILYLHAIKPVIELMLISQSESLLKEIENIWKTIVSVFKGLGKSLSYKLLLSYKEIIIQAANHSSVNIAMETSSILEIADGLHERTNYILEEIRKKVELDSSLVDTDSLQNAKDSAGKKSKRSVRMVGSFLNAKSINLSPVFNTQKDKNKDEGREKRSPSPNSDLKGYVYIDTDNTFDVNNFTEHQKDVFKRRKDDIATIRNDLSQSSIDTQNLQEWFEKGTKFIAESSKIYESKESDAVTKSHLDNEDNKENKIHDAESGHIIADKTVVLHSDSKLNENIDKKALTHESDSNEIVDQYEEVVSEQVDFIAEVPSIVNQETVDTALDNKITESQESDTSKLKEQPNSQLEEDREQRLSPSILDSKRRNYNSAMKKTIANAVQKNGKNRLKKRMYDALNVFMVKEKANEQLDPMNVNEESTNENKRGVKRKIASDSDSDSSINSRRRRKLSHISESSSNHDNEENNSVYTDAMTEGQVVSQRTKNEMSRLKINMVFDSPLPSRRRTKIYDDNNKKSKSDRHKPISVKSDEMKNSQKFTDKDLKTCSTLNTGRKRNKKNVKHNTEKNAEAEGKSTDITFIETTTDVLEMDQSENLDNVNMDNCATDPLSDTENTDVVQEKPTLLKTVVTNIEKKAEQNNSPNENILDAKEHVDNNQEHQDKIDEIVESSQKLNSESKLNTKYPDKECFIKINKIEHLYTLKRNAVCSEDDNSVQATNNVVEIDDISEVDDNTCKNKSERNNDANASLIQEIDCNTQCEDEDKTSETSEINGKISKSPSINNFTSPRSNTKRYTAFKHYATQGGRAAHMLDLVTKQVLTESEAQNVRTDDELTMKRSKFKETENEEISGKREKLSLVKENDKIVGSPGTRQEKIFNNMKSTEFSLPSSVKLFSNLKNDGEKISSKMERSTSDYVPVHIDGTCGKESDDNSLFSTEKDALPMLEWSSANPPSLTASPSASILKRHRLNLTESDLDAVVSKKKRVSFADPPVSKEMGYEITTIISPHRVNKLSSSRGILYRKDSTIKLKPSKLNFVQFNSEKSEEEEVTRANHGSEVDLQCERENELLTKIAEELEYTDHMSIDADNDVQCTFAESTLENMNKVHKPETCATDTIDNLTNEVKVDLNSILRKDGESSTNEKTQDENNSIESTPNSSNIIMDKAESETIETQDLFSNSDETPTIKTEPSFEQNDPTEQNLSSENNSINSVTQYNTSNEFVLTNMLKKEENFSNMEDLEDTIDIENITGFNSTRNSDEMFCVNPLQSNTQAMENVAEQDTLTVTDSVFTSLPVTQDVAELSQPELLDSDQPICPELISCQEAITSIINFMVTPLWLQHLSSYLESRGVHTIGDLATLSEREINRIPVTGSPRVPFVKMILKQYMQKKSVPKSTGTVSSEKEKATDLNQTIYIKRLIPIVPMKVNTVAEPTSNVPLSNNTPDSQVPTSTRNLDVDLPKKSIVTTEQSSGLTSINENLCGLYRPFQSPCFNLSVLNKTSALLSLVPQTLQGPPTEMKSTSSVSTSPLNFTTLTLNGVVSGPISSAVIIASPTMDTGEINSSNATQTLRILKSVGTITDVTMPAKVGKNSSKPSSADSVTEEQLDEIDASLLLKTAIRRCSAENILMQYKLKMRNMSDTDLEKETIRMLGLENKHNYNEVTLKTACRACGVNKVLLRLPDIFIADTEFFRKVLNTYRKKIKVSDCLEILNINEIKDAICQKCTSLELAEMLSKTLTKEEELQGIKNPITDLSFLSTILKRIPMDGIISHTVANEELIPSQIVLDIALQNNSPEDITRVLHSQSSTKTKQLFDKLWSTELATSHIKTNNVSKESLIDIFKAISTKLSAQELLEVYHESMRTKLIFDENK